MLKKMVLFVLLVTTIFLYDLVFNISYFFPEKCFFFLHLVASVLYSHVTMASISEAFPNFTRLPYRLYIPSSFCQTPVTKWHANGVGQVFVTKIDSNLGVLQWAMLLLLCLCLQQFKTRHFHLILLSNLLYSTLTLVCVVVTVIVLMNWKVISRNVPSGEERGETDVFAGYHSGSVSRMTLKKLV